MTTEVEPTTEAEYQRWYFRQAQRKKRARWLSKGLCSYCGRVPPVADRTMCAECLGRQSERVKKWRQRHGAYGFVVCRTEEITALARGFVVEALAERAQRYLQQRDESAQGRSAVDPSVASTGTPSTRA